MRSIACKESKVQWHCAMRLRNAIGIHVNRLCSLWQSPAVLYCIQVERLDFVNNNGGLHKEVRDSRVDSDEFENILKVKDALNTRKATIKKVL